MALMPGLVSTVALAAKKMVPLRSDFCLTLGSEVC